MGYYINPPDMSKESFLKLHGSEITRSEFVAHNDFQNMIAICLVNNGPFTAAAIAYKQSEITAFTDPDDCRPKKYYLIPASVITLELAGEVYPNAR